MKAPDYPTMFARFLQPNRRRRADRPALGLRQLDYEA